MQDAQTQLLQQAVEMGCNAVLSINSSAAINSYGEDSANAAGRSVVLVTLVGTPCVIMQSDNLPVVQSEAYVVPDYV